MEVNVKVKHRDSIYNQNHCQDRWKYNFNLVEIIVKTPENHFRFRKVCSIWFIDDGFLKLFERMALFKSGTVPTYFISQFRNKKNLLV